MHAVLTHSFLKDGQSLGGSGQKDLLHQFIGTYPSVSPGVNSTVKG